LRGADLPGFKVSTEQEHETAAEKKLGREFLHCVGPVAFRQGLAEASSKNLERETSTSDESAKSFVEVARSPAAAAEQLAATRSTHARACFARFATKAFRAESHGQGTVAPVSVATFTPVARETNGTFGWRFSTTLSTHGLHLPVQFDISGFGYRMAVVAVFTVGFPHPFPAAEEQRLFSLLVGRAQSSPA
jgi:hypothetical protein